MGKYADLDVLVPDERKVKLAGKEYIIPGSLPVKKMIEALKYGQKIADGDFSGDNIDNFLKVLFSILKIKNTNISYEEFVNSITLEQAVAFFNFLYAGIEPQQTQELIEKETKKISNEK